MKIFFSESKPEYGSYTFNYGIYCIKQEKNELNEIYQRGFLPYSANISLESEVFYLARSLRVDLNRFEDTSENRRVNRKLEVLDLSMQMTEKKDIIHADPSFLPFCQSYVKSRIGEAMSNTRLQYILSLTYGTHIFKFSRAGTPVGYVLSVCTEQIIHYWFSFFDLDLMKSHSLGKWMMWSVIKWAKEQGKSHVYLGTAYGNKSLYKVRDHKGLSFFDGSKWNQDMELLKSWCKSDHERDATDRFKLAEDPNAYITHYT